MTRRTAPPKKHRPEETAMQEDTRHVAEKFIRDQFKIMEKHGSAPKLGTKEYRKLITTTQKTFQALRENSSRENSSRDGSFPLIPSQK
jgi:hypothetical protein